MAVDIARRPYTTVARFFRNSDQEVKVKWVKADPARGTFPGVSKICSLDWVSHPETAEGVGEVFGKSRSYNGANGFGPIRGNHFCGTLDEHRNGEVLDPSKPLMQYAPSGLPLCCDPARREASGGPSVIGTTHAVTSHPYRTSGRVAVLGRALTIRSDPFTVTGRVSVSTSSTHTIRSDPYHASGGPKVIGVTVSAEADPYHSTGGPKVTDHAFAVTYPPIEVCEDEECCPLPVGHPTGPLSCVGCWCYFDVSGDLSLIRRYEVIPGRTYRLEYAFHLGNVSTVWTLWRGGTWETREEVASGSEHPRNRSIDFTATGDYVWWELTSPTTTSILGFVRLIDIT